MKSAGVFVTTAWDKKALHELSDSAYKVINCLRTYMNIRTGEAEPARETIGRDIGKSVSSVSRAVAELKEKKYVSIREVQSKTGKFTHNVYRILHFNTEQKKMLSTEIEGDKYDIIKRYTRIS